MANFSKFFVYPLLFLCLVVSQLVYGAQQSPSGSQSYKKTIEFFQDEMRFKTNPYSVKSAIDEKAKNITIIDVRSAQDYAAGHIPGAINIPYEKYNGFQGNEQSFPELRRDGYNYIYCYELLCDLAKNAAIKFASLGYPVKEIAGGFAAWKEKGYPIEKGQ